MKALWQRRENRAFTLVEMLVVIAIIGILAALLLPALVGGKKRAQRVQCISNLKEVGTAFQIFAHDHQGRFPMAAPIAEGGSQEYTTAAEALGGSGFYFSWRHFQPLANDLVTPKPLVCPADLEREPAASFSVLQNSNVSYAVGVTADYNEPSSVLATDRNLTNNILRLTSTAFGSGDLTWTRELHFFKGNVLFADSHVEQWNSLHLSAPTNTVLFLPTVPPTSIASAPPPAGPGPQPSPGPVTAGGTSPSGPPGHSNLSKPLPQMATPLGRTVTTLSEPRSDGSNGSSYLVENNARENKRGAATNLVANPLAAPPVEDYQLPLARLFGAARSDGPPKSHWLLWLLLLLLAGATAYGYSRFKRHFNSERDGE